MKVKAGDATGEGGGRGRSRGMGTMLEVASEQKSLQSIFISFCA